MSTDLPKLNRFNPPQPQIPGLVAQSIPESEASGWRIRVPSQVSQLLRPLLALLVCVTLAAIGLAWLTKHPTPLPNLAPAPEASAQPDAARTHLSDSDVPQGPVTVARVVELSRPWSAKRFQIRKGQSGRVVPALLVRLPRGASRSTEGYWAFVLEEPFGRCELEYVTDLQRLEREFGYRAQHPMVVDPCNGSVYHPLRMGTRTDGALVRGEVVAGPAIRPPLAVQLRVHGGNIVAVRTE